MKMAVLSDIHGNLAALEQVIEHVQAWQPDQVVVNGDIVSRGPRSRDCFLLLLEQRRRNNWFLLKGNHEEYVLDCGRPDCATAGPAFEIERFAHWTYQQLNGEIKALAALPEQFESTAPDGRTLRVVHASMRNNRDGIYVRTTDDEVRKHITSPSNAPPVAPPAVFVTAHTHRPLIRRLDDMLVVNIGSVGAPFDKDRRAGYGQFTWSCKGWQARVTRVEYDRQKTERDYVESGFLDEAGPLAQLMLLELRKARGLIFRWAHRYETAVRNGELTMEESVRRIMGEEDVRSFAGPPGWSV
jgi:predicted phosphodiesterase